LPSSTSGAFCMNSSCDRPGARWMLANNGMRSPQVGTENQSVRYVVAIFSTLDP
jgi:hypothetical protein